MSDLILPTRNDAALMNAVLGSGVQGRDKSLGYSIGTFTLLPKEYVEVLHAESFECARVVETLPEEMTREWVELTIDDGDSDIITKVQEYDKRLGLADAFREAQTKANLYGGAIAILYADDGSNPNEPLNEKKLRTIEGVNTLDRWQVQGVGGTLTDPEYYQVVNNPQFQLFDPYGQVLKSAALGDWGGMIHKSRVLRFDGDWCPYQTRQYNQGWGLSKLQRFLKPFQDYFSVYNALGAMVQDASLFTYKINNLMDIIKSGDIDLLKARLRENWMAASVYGMMITDKNEDVGFTDRNFSGLDQMADRFERRLVAGSDGLPHSYVLGRSGPNGGLDGNGEAEDKYMAKLVKRRQEKCFRSHLERCFHLIFAAKDGPTSGKEQKFGVNFRPLYLPTPQELADLEASVVQKDATAISAGIYTAEEVAKSHYSTPNFNPAITIDWELREQQAKEQEQAGLEAGLEAFEEGGAEAPADDGAAEPQAEESATPDDIESILQELEGEGVSREQAIALLNDEGVDTSELQTDSITRHADGLMLPPIAVQKSVKQALNQKPKLPLKDQGMMQIAQLISTGKLPTFEQINQAVGWFTRGSENDPVFQLLGGKEGLKWWRAVQAQAIAERMRDKKDTRMDAARASCMNCVEKHVSRAIALFEELPNYPEHRLLAIGNLAEAESESADMFPELSEGIRQIRLRYQEDDIIPDYREFVDLFKAFGVWRGDSAECGKGWEGIKGKCSRAKRAKRSQNSSKAGHAAEHLAESTISWSAGRLIGGAIANVAASHGLDPTVSKVIAEAGVQALTATVIHARKKENRKPGELARKFISEAAGATVGKVMHHEADQLLERGDEHVRTIAAVASGKISGATATATVSGILKRGERTLNRVLGQKRVDDRSADLYLRDAVQLTSEDESALFDLTFLGMLLQQRRQDAKGQGVACGQGWISPRARCSKGKSAATPKEALKKTAENRKKLHSLKAEVARDKGKKATAITGKKPLETTSFDKLLKDLDQVDISQYQGQEALMSPEVARSAMRGQGRRSGGTVKGGMGGVSGLTGTRSTLKIPSEYTQDLTADEKSEVGQLYLNEKGDYLKGRIKGLSHNAAMALVYGIQNQEDRDAALKIIKEEVLKPVSRKQEKPAIALEDVKTPEQKAEYAAQEAKFQRQQGNKENAKAWDEQAKQARIAALQRDIKKQKQAQTSLFGVTEHASDMPLFSQDGMQRRSDRGMPTAKQACGRGWQGTKPGCKRASAPGQKTAPKPKKSTAPKPGTIAEISPNDILADPKRFQYKIIGEHTATGEVGSLSGVKRYDPNLAGIVQVWVDPADGKTYVVNGHNRLALAKKLGAEQVAVRYLDVKDAKEARAIGAVTNIAEGRGTALDAAKFFKDTGLSKADLDAKGIPMREKIATDGLALSSLDDSLFRKVINGEIPTERAVIIGGSGLSPTKQRDLYDLAEKKSKRGGKITNDVLSELVDTVKASEESSETQFDLFGASEVQQTNAIERASLQASLKRKLSRDKKLFGTVGKSKAAQDLARAGNQIDVDASSKLSQEAATTLGVFDKLKNVRGGVSDALNSAASRIKSGEDKKKVESELYDLIRNEIKRESVGRKDSTRHADRLPLKQRQANKRDLVFKHWKQGELNVGRSDKMVPRSKRGHKQAIAVALALSKKTK